MLLDYNSGLGMNTLTSHEPGKLVKVQRLLSILEFTIGFTLEVALIVTGWVVDGAFVDEDIVGFQSLSGI